MWHNIKLLCWIFKKFNIIDELKTWQDVVSVTNITVLPALQGKKLYYTTYKCTVSNKDKVVTGIIVKE